MIRADCFGFPAPPVPPPFPLGTPVFLRAEGTGCHPLRFAFSLFSPLVSPCGRLVAVESAQCCCNLLDPYGVARALHANALTRQFYSTSQGSQTPDLGVAPCRRCLTLCGTRWRGLADQLCKTMGEPPGCQLSRGLSSVLAVLVWLAVCSDSRLLRFAQPGTRH